MIEQGEGKVLIDIGYYSLCQVVLRHGGSLQNSRQLPRDIVLPINTSPSLKVTEHLQVNITLAVRKDIQRCTGSLQLTMAEVRKRERDLTADVEQLLPTASSLAKVAVCRFAVIHF